MRLTTVQRHSKSRSSFAGGGPKGKEGFYIGDKSHARAAISGATRSFHAGNISQGTADRIKAKARRKLGGMDGPATFK